ncbi:tRNA (adenine-N1)-methyltransferase [Desulfovibrio subterraneus]|uniref:tRNA (adenine(58)-N(1))-methyltransferase TrmI n=1 Tax=Desulfovibrio subterraneus TaxID=2718620 RepID=A0A7J0BEP7_9BACT|nr:tRNA (adenine-N1)-methyltransferase [Desulfovibrio subterraneus]WBF66708.1 tRNA (adenine-N1)-methyltransferase [Desulfovibrio subterraneus]GFM31652.1 tRNA (adenine-N1)-methyltransferase [Desulfovibrio subterraneus]
MPKQGELVLLISPRGKRYMRRVEPENDIHGTDGLLKMTDIMEAGYGSVVYTHKGKPYRVQRPALHDLVTGVKRQTQVIYPKDIGYICMKLGVGNGTKIIEAGSGSGSLTMALSWFAGDRGEIHTHEARLEFMNLCRRNLDWAGVGQNVTLYNHDISNGFLINDADALFLDVRDPWEYVRHIPSAVKPGAMCGFLVPTIDQVSSLLVELEKGPFDEVEVSELLLRKWKPVPDRMRPSDRMVAHTGFLIFCRHQEGLEEINAQKSLGTRERKQEAARLERLGLSSIPEDALCGGIGPVDGDEADDDGGLCED